MNNVSRGRFEKKKKASGLSPHISCHRVTQAAAALKAAHRCPFHSRAENDKFNKLKVGASRKHLWNQTHLMSRPKGSALTSQYQNLCGRGISFRGEKECEDVSGVVGLGAGGARGEIESAR